MGVLSLGFVFKCRRRVICEASWRKRLGIDRYTDWFHRITQSIIAYANFKARLPEPHVPQGGVFLLFNLVQIILDLFQGEFGSCGLRQNFLGKPLALAWLIFLNSGYCGSKGVAVQSVWTEERLRTQLEAVDDGLVPLRLRLVPILVLILLFLLLFLLLRALVGLCSLALLRAHLFLALASIGFLGGLSTGRATLIFFHRHDLD